VVTQLLPQPVDQRGVFEQLHALGGHVGGHPLTIPYRGQSPAEHDAIEAGDDSTNLGGVLSSKGLQDSILSMW
jgi:hypothetical protein